MFPSFVVLALAGAVLVCGPDEAAPARARRAVQIGDELAGRRLNYLATRSATMKQALDILESTPALSVRLRSSTLLRRTTQRNGTGLYWREGPQIIMLLQFDSAFARPLEQIESVAHEIAHVVEVACLPHVTEIGQLRSHLLRRGGRVVSGLPGRALETPFAQDAGRRIVLEALRGRPDVGRLAELAEKYKLGSRCIP
jgi:hypothetical protein